MALLATVVVAAAVLLFCVRTYICRCRKNKTKRNTTTTTTTASTTTTSTTTTPTKCPISVNYHFSRRCNKTCGFCFHTATTSHIESLTNAKQGLRLLKAAGMRKLNFAGGEPFLHPKFLSPLLRFSKQELALESISIVTNGSLVKESFLRQHAGDIDILAVSCDSFDEGTNVRIGRGTGENVRTLYRIREWCEACGIRFKINTVVCRLNVGEDMNLHLAALRPFRWKCFQVLLVEGENESASAGRLRDVREWLISDEEYTAFIRRHESHAFLVPEPNRLMAKSYLILDEYMRFLDREGRAPSRSILEVGVEEALASVYWDEQGFRDRGGLYEWSRTAKESGGGCGGKLDGLDW